MPSLRSCLAVVVVVVAVACGGKAPPAQGALSSRWTAPALLAQVPASSPYVFALLEPINEAMRVRMMQRFEPQAAQAMAKLDALRAMDRGQMPPWMRALLAVAEELRGSKPSEWFQRLGLDPRGRFVLYGLSMWPVARIEIADPAKVKAVIDRLLAAGGYPSQQRSLDGRPYWLAGGSDFSLVLAVLDRQAVAAVLPTAALDTGLPLVLGTRAPEHSLATGSVLPEALARHHFLGSLFGYFDLRNLVDIFAGPQPGPLDLPIRAATGPVSPVCRGELERMTAVVPRLVVGYRKLDGDSFESSLVFEMSPTTLTSLRKLQTAVPEVTSTIPGHPLGMLGVAADPNEVISWARDVAQQIHARPFSCPWFAGINKASDELAGKLATPLPPTWRGLRGMSLTIDDASLSPPGVTGHLVIAGERVADLVSSLAGTVPAFAGIPLARDGRPIALPVQQLQLPVHSAHLALTTDRLVIAAGEGSERRVVEHLATRAPQRSPLMVIAFDGPKLQRILEAAGQKGVEGLASFGQGGFALEVGDAGLELRIWGDNRGSPQIAAPPPSPSKP